MTKEVNDSSIGFPKDNKGNLLKEYPMQVFGDMVLIENKSRTSDPTALTQEDGFFFQSDTVEHETMRGWEVVAVGELVSRVKVGDIVGQPIGNSITPIQHPMIALKVDVENEHGNIKPATKHDLDYVYAVVNHQLIGMRYVTQE